jgi:hypothetical protein
MIAQETRLLSNYYGSSESKRGGTNTAKSGGASDIQRAVKVTSGNGWRE